MAKIAKVGAQKLDFGVLLVENPKFFFLASNLFMIFLKVIKFLEKFLSHDPVNCILQEYII